MATDVELARLILKLYRAAGDASQWPAALGQLSYLTRSYASNFLLWDKSGDVPIQTVVETARTDANRDYARYWTGFDPRLPIVARNPVGELFRCHLHFNDAYTAKSRFYDEFLIPHGGRYVAGTKLIDDSKLRTVIALHRDARAGPYDQGDSRLLLLVFPHLAQAIELFHRMNQLRSANARLSAALERLPWGVVLVDREARIVESNRAAGAMLTRQDAIRSRVGRIEANKPTLTAELHRLIANACGAAIGAATAPAGPMRIERPGGGHLAILVSPCVEQLALFDRARYGAVLFITDSEQRRVTPEAGLRSVFGLTRAEAAVALEIADGRTVAAIAEAHGVSRNTVRVQTQAVLEKTGASRQAELVRLILSLPAAIAPH